ncbi:PREDICTED: uncharacterized protein LOC109131140 [Camelina sativa]|uniref:Uncharacterized protein LOC109131140 n=1 Tax=Camelina sativa TaxID=90675 RepID=A0ABM1RE73_CAMSA|nr:PREDICTED: uncharacterized protein LOC109131140 [Camelina sativa]
MVNTQNTLFVFRPDQQALAPQPLTPFSAVTANRASAIRRCLMISAKTLEMILDDEIAPEEDDPSIITPSLDSLLVCPVTSCF